MANERVCHLSSVHQYLDTRIFIKECSSLAINHYDTHFVVPDSDEKVMNGVHIHNVPKSDGGRLARMTKTVWRVYKKARSLDASLYHFHDPELIPIGLLFKFLGKKVIYDVHEDVPRQILNKYWIKKPIRRLISWTFEKIENFSAKRFDAVITATPYINERFTKLGCNAVNVSNYPILEEFLQNPIQWGLKENAVCYIGGITGVRGLFEMVDAINQTDINLYLAGRFFTEDEHQEVKKQDGWKNVIELGQINRKEIAQILAKSKAGMVVLHPIENFIDSLPIKMFEYMAAGIPVIASNFPLWKEIIEEHHCGICVDPLNPSEIAEAIQWILKNPDEGQYMGTNGRNAAINEYNWNSEKEKLITTYQKVLKIGK
ncbi:glycosyltransferase family 4 protein [Tepidibacillus marianensis]|uniref:glycosyltransferase family 4 protein n=1 Tax=Tepidibacillus marianensis TaxID=3131995 RepID=UPI0030D5F5B5